MKNLKRRISIMLVVAMLFSLMCPVTNYAEQETENAEYAEELPDGEVVNNSRSKNVPKMMKSAAPLMTGGDYQGPSTYVRTSESGDSLTITDFPKAVFTIDEQLSSEHDNITLYADMDNWDEHENDVIKFVFVASGSEAVTSKNVFSDKTGIAYASSSNAVGRLEIEIKLEDIGKITENEYKFRVFTIEVNREGAGNRFQIEIRKKENGGQGGDGGGGDDRIEFGVSKPDEDRIHVEEQKPGEYRYSVTLNNLNKLKTTSDKIELTYATDSEIDSTWYWSDGGEQEESIGNCSYATLSEDKHNFSITFSFDEENESGNSVYGKLISEQHESVVIARRIRIYPDKTNHPEQYKELRFFVEIRYGGDGGGQEEEDTNLLPLDVKGDLKSSLTESQGNRGQLLLGVPSDNFVSLSNTTDSLTVSFATTSEIDTEHWDSSDGVECHKNSDTYTVSHTFNLNKTAEKSIYATLSELGYYDIVKEVRIKENDEYRPWIFEFHVSVDGASSTSMKGIHIYNEGDQDNTHRLTVELDGMDQNSANDFPIETQWVNDSTGGYWQFTVKPTSVDHWQSIVNNVDLQDGVYLRFTMSTPSDSITKYYVSHCQEDIDKYGNYSGKPASEILKLSAYSISSNGLPRRNNIAVRKENATDKTITLSPYRQDENYSTVEYVWYDSSNRAYQLDESGSKVELLKYRVNVDLTDAITVGLPNTLPKTFIKTGSLDGVSSLTSSYKNGILVYKADRGQIAEKKYEDLNTIIELPAEYSNYELSIDAMPDNDAIGTNGVDTITAYFKDGLEYNNGSSGCFRVLLKNKSTGVTTPYILYVRMEMQGVGLIFDGKGIQPISSTRVSIDEHYTKKNGNSRGYTLGYNKWDQNNGELEMQWTGGPIDIDDLLYDSSHTDNLAVLVAPPNNGKTPVGYTVYCPESAMRFINRQESVVLAYEEMDHLKVSDAFEDENMNIRVPHPYMPVPFEVGGHRFYTVQREVDEYDGSGWVFIKWIYEDEKPIYEYLYSTIQEGHTHTSIPEDVYGDTHRPMVNVSENEAFDLDVKYYAKSEESGDVQAEYYELEAFDKVTAEHPSESNKVTVRFEYPEGIDYGNYESHNLRLIHFVDGLSNEPIEEELVFAEDGIYVELSSCSPFLLEWEKNKEVPRDVLDIDAIVEKLKQIGIADPDPEKISVEIVYSEPEDTHENSNGEITWLVLDISPQIVYDGVPVNVSGSTDDWFKPGTSFTLRIPVPENAFGKYANVIHRHNGKSDTYKDIPIEGEGYGRYIDIDISGFSPFEITFSDTLSTGSTRSFTRRWFTHPQANLLR